jgi:hypothetical protein
MVFNGHSSGSSYTTILLSEDILIKLMEIAKSNLNRKLVRPQIPRRIAIDSDIIIEPEYAAAITKEMRDRQWQTALNNAVPTKWTELASLHRHSSASGITSKKGQCYD